MKPKTERPLFRSTSGETVERRAPENPRGLGNGLGSFDPRPTLLTIFRAKRRAWHASLNPSDLES